MKGSMLFQKRCFSISDSNWFKSSKDGKASIDLLKMKDLDMDMDKDKLKKNEYNRSLNAQRNFLSSSNKDFLFDTV